MWVEKEIQNLKVEIEQVNYKIEEVGLLLNSKGELTKILEILLELSLKLKIIESLLNKKDDTLLSKIKTLWRKIW